MISSNRLEGGEGTLKQRRRLDVIGVDPSVSAGSRAGCDEGVVTVRDVTCVCVWLLRIDSIALDASDRPTDLVL